MFQASVKTNLVDTNVYNVKRDWSRQLSDSDGDATRGFYLPGGNAGLARPARDLADLPDCIIPLPIGHPSPKPAWELP
jgi:hypothetical protein